MNSIALIPNGRRKCSFFIATQKTDAGWELFPLFKGIPLQNPINSGYLPRKLSFFFFGTWSYLSQDCWYWGVVCLRKFSISPAVLSSIKNILKTRKPGVRRCNLKNICRKGLEQKSQGAASKALPSGAQAMGAWELLSMWYHWQAQFEGHQICERNAFRWESFKNWVVVSKIFYFHPYFGEDSQFD